MTYTVEQLKSVFLRQPFPKHIADSYAIIPELISELEARNREIEQLKGKLSIHESPRKGSGVKSSL